MLPFCVRRVSVFLIEKADQVEVVLHYKIPKYWHYRSLGHWLCLLPAAGPLPPSPPGHPSVEELTRRVDAIRAEKAQWIREVDGR